MYWMSITTLLKCWASDTNVEIVTLYLIHMIHMIMTSLYLMFCVVCRDGCCTRYAVSGVEETG